MVVAQLVERLLLIPEVRGLMQSLAKFILNICILVYYQLYLKDKN